MMALPAPLWAKDDGRYDHLSKPGATEGVPVILQQVNIDGQAAWLAIAPVPEAQEQELVSNLAKHHPETTVLQIAGADDPALKAAAKTGYLKHIKTFVMGSVEQSPMFTAGNLPARVKQKLRERLQKITDFSKSETASGLMYSLIYSGVQGFFTAYASSSVSSGMAVMSMFFLWNAMVLTKPEYWGRILQAGGNGALTVAGKVAELFGVELSDRDKRIYEVVGKFAMSWAVTTAQGAAVKSWSGDFAGLQGWHGVAEGFADSSISGVQNNYNIWDAIVLGKFAEGKWSKSGVQRYFKIQMVLGAILEALAFRQVPYVGLFLGTVTALGLGYLALHPHSQAAVSRRAQKITVVFKSGVTYITNPEMSAQGARAAGRTIQRAVDHCANMLAAADSPVLPHHRRVAWEDTQ